LTAAKSVLKICEHKALQQGILPLQFLNLSKVMLDESTQLREIFLNRLHKGLSRSSSENSLPLEFLSLYVFGGIEKDIHLLDLMRKNFNNILNMKTKILKVNDKGS
jgi:sister-chromatid-cohesion protein PDS5